MTEMEFFYPHTCTIKRSSGEADDNGIEIMTTLYSGIGGLQIGTNGDETLQGGIYQKVPTLIIPITSVAFLTGDYVSVTVPECREESYTVRSVKIEVGDGVDGTTLWLKKGTELL